jgi:hypothetical protein
MGEARRRRTRNRQMERLIEMQTTVENVAQPFLDKVNRSDRFKSMADDDGRPAMPDGYKAPLKNPYQKDLVLIDPPKRIVEDVIDRLREEDKPYTRVNTPAADWREQGKPDPHGDYYDHKKRDAIMGGQFTDDEVAYKCGMASGRDLESISTLHMAKERIRWLSRQLVAAEKRIQELEGK